MSICIAAGKRKPVKKVYAAAIAAVRFAAKGLKLTEGMEGHALSVRTAWAGSIPAVRTVAVTAIMTA